MLFDVVIIGSGLGGLECAQVLSKEGLSVCIVEKNRQFGGLCQSFIRKGKKIDSSIHYVGSLDQGQILHQYFSYLGIMNSLNVVRLNSDAYENIHINNETYRLAQNHDHFIETLTEQFPKDRESITKYIEILKKVGDLSSVEVLKEGHFSLDGMDYFTISAKSVIDTLFTNEKLQKILWSTSLLYAGDELHTPFYIHAVTNNSNIQGAYRFKGGASQISDELVNKIKSNGGVLINNSAVNRIIVSNNVVKGVVTEQGETIEARYVISNVNPKMTLRLIDKNQFLKSSFHTRINSNTSSYGLFCLYIIVKPNTIKYTNSNHYINKQSKSINSVLLSMQPPVINQEYAEIVTVVTPMEFTEVESWSQTTIGSRGNAYAEFKERKIEELLKYVSDYFPNLRENIEHYYSATPLTFRDYTADQRGSAYGIKKSCKSPYSTLISPKTKLPNLLLTGQNLNFHGVLGVTITAMLTCSEILGEEYLAKKIGNL